MFLFFNQPNYTTKHYTLTANNLATLIGVQGGGGQGGHVPPPV